MYDCLITFRSVMPAQRAEELLSQRGIHCAVRRTAKWMESQGCGYSLWLRSGQLAQAVSLLRKHNITYRKLYEKGEGGALEEMQL